MKVIDLLNKIANNGVDDKIRHIKYYNRNDEENDICMLCYENLIYKLNNGSLDLNDEVEILEEEKKIPKKLDIRQEKNIKNNWKWKVYGKEHSYNISTPQKIIAEKVNEILDFLKSKGE